MTKNRRTDFHTRHLINNLEMLQLWLDGVIEYASRVDSLDPVEIRQLGAQAKALVNARAAIRAAAQRPRDWIEQPD